MTADSSDPDRPSRPTPVRAAMGKSQPLKAESQAPSRIFDLEAQRWIVRAAGATRSGTGSDTGAPLLFLTFAREEEPDRPVREAIAVASDLEALTWDELEELFARSRPFREP